MRTRLFPISIGFLILVLMTWLSATQQPFVKSVRNRLEDLFYDQFVTFNSDQYPRSKNKILIVDIDEESISQIGRWPWPRKHMIELINKISLGGAAVIAFDVVFSEPDVHPVNVLLQLASQNEAFNKNSFDALEKFRELVQSDQELAVTLTQSASDIVLGFVIHNNTNNSSKGSLPAPILKLDKKREYVLEEFGGYFANIPVLEKAAKNGGFMTTLPDGDGVIRRAPLVLRLGDSVYPSLSLEAARLYLAYKEIGIDWSTHDNKMEITDIKLGSQKRIYTGGFGQILIPFRSSAKQYPYISASSILNGKVPKELFQDGLVFVGSSSFRFGDLHSVPLQPTFPGVEIQATVADAIINSRNLYAPSWSRELEIILTIIIGILLALSLPFLSVTGTVIVSLLTISSLLGGYYYLFTTQGIVIGVTSAVGQVLVNATFNLGYGLLYERGRRKTLKNLFGQYVPKEHVEMMSERPESYSGEGYSANLTVLFADIVGFTSIVQKLSASEVRSLLNQFFTPMTQIIFENKGTVDKYVGDLIMAFWGAPIEDAEHTQHALTAALQMRQEVEHLKTEFKSRGLPEIEIGIGVNRGDMSVGDMGSKFRKAYTVLGDAVNVASRVEGLVRYYGVKIAVGEAAREGQSEFAFRHLDRVKVVGRQAPLNIFELISTKAELSAEKQLEVEMHERALNFYFIKDWDSANALFEELAQRNPVSKLYPLFLKRIKDISGSVPEDWDGSYQWGSK